MFYKIVLDNIVVDVVKNIRYIRYLSNSRRIVPTDKSSAHGVCGSDNRTYYALQGRVVPAEKQHWPVVTVSKISEQDYNYYKTKLGAKEKVYSNLNALNLVRETKLQELSAACKSAIEAGVSITLSDNAEHMFRMTLEDQLNLVDIEDALNNGAKEVIYHETNQVCRWFSAQDMRTIIYKLRVHKNHHTTYYNLLKHCIINMYSIDEIRSLSYGVDLLTLNVSDDILSIVKERL